MFRRIGIPEVRWSDQASFDLSRGRQAHRGQPFSLLAGVSITPSTMALRSDTPEGPREWPKCYGEINKYWYGPNPSHL